MKKKLHGGGKYEVIIFDAYDSEDVLMVKMIESCVHDKQEPLVDVRLKGKHTDCEVCEEIEATYAEGDEEENTC